MACNSRPSSSHAGTAAAAAFNTDAITMSLICQYWAYPQGKFVPAVVISMNHFVKSGDTFIPSEIALVSFTIEGGITNSYCTIIDLESIPQGNELEADSHAKKLGVPPPPFSELFRDYHGIVEEIELFIRLYSAQDEGAETIVFCLSEDMEAVKGGLDWLYDKVKHTFPYKLYELETLLVTLTLGGLENLAVDLENGLEFPDILAEFRAALKNHSEASKKKESGFNLSDFSVVSGLDRASYATIGKYGRNRVAFMRQNQFPFAMLGGFLLSEQATQYLNQSGLLHLEWLACTFHRGKVVFQGDDQNQDQSKSKENPGGDERVSCALMRTRSHLYLALDAMLPNYKVLAKRGYHYPDEMHPKWGEQEGMRTLGP